MESLKFDNRFTRELPADPVLENTRHQVTNALYSRVTPTTVKGPHLISFSAETAALLGLSEDDCTGNLFTEVFSGNRVIEGMDPHATCYGGHQFGNWAGQLGDGRAINLGELVNAQGHYTLQLKGAGPTPYSRTADGLAVLRSSVREFLCSEAMFHLGVSTTRALCLIGTGEAVMRDVLYDGHPAPEPGAVVCRVSPSFVRFGHFQMLTARNEPDLLRKFTNFVIERDFPEFAGTKGPDKYIGWFNEVGRRTARMVIDWMRVGFVHGVMNTDNMSILGETIDYGPYGWLEDFDPDWTPNTTDAQHRRYRYGQQPGIAQWNLMQLANAILPLVEEPKPLEEGLSQFARAYEEGWQQMMAAKLGLKRFDSSLNDSLIQLLTARETDMTLFFRHLADVDFDADSPADPLFESHYLLPDKEPNQEPDAEIRDATTRWLADYRNVLSQQGVDLSSRKAAMNAVNPKYVLRNYLAQLAIDEAEKGNFDLVNKTLDVLRRPYDEQPENESFAEKRPEWARTRVGCSMLSCSS